VSVSTLGEAATVQAGVTLVDRKLDGTAASANGSRKRAVFYSALQYAVERKRPRIQPA
jgi:hypothetical protein